METLCAFWESSPTAVAQFSRCSGRTVRLVWHCIATAVRELCYGRGKPLLRAWENFGTSVRELWHSNNSAVPNVLPTKKTFLLFFGAKNESGLFPVRQVFFNQDGDVFDG